MDNSFKWHSVDFRLLAAGVSLLLSALMAISGWLPNEDAFTYIRTVDVLNSDGLVAAFRHYPWAAYSVLIAVVHNLFNVEPLTAAVIVNALFYSLLVFSFISLVAEIDNDRRTLLLAAISILVYPQLNEYRLVVIRDSAFWALALFGLWQFTHFMGSRKPSGGVLFSAAFLLATAFRIEALLFLFTVPLALFIDERIPLRARLRQFALFTASSTVSLLLVTAAMAMAGLAAPQLIGDQLESYLPFINDTFFPAELRTAEMSRAIFGDYAANFTADYLPLFMSAGLVAVMIAFLFRGIGGPFLIVVIAGLLNRVWRIPRYQSAPLLVVVLINSLIALGFLVTTRFLSTRYVMLLCIVVALFVPLVLSRLILLARNKGNSKITGRLIGLLLLYCAVDAYISFGADRSYLREAGDWVSQNTPETTELLTNNRVFAYYSRRVENYDDLQIVLTRDQILQLDPGTLIGFEEDTSTIGLFDSPELQSAVDEVIRFGDESERQLIVFKKR